MDGWMERWEVWGRVHTVVSGLASLICKYEYVMDRIAGRRGMKG